MENIYQTFPLVSNLDKSFADIIIQSTTSDWKPVLFVNGQMFQIAEWKDTLKTVLERNNVKWKETDQIVLTKNIAPPPMLQVLYGPDTFTLDWKVYQYAPLSILLKELERLTHLNRWMMLLKVGSSRVIPLDRPDQPIEWSRFGFGPFRVVVSMCRPQDQECSICLKTVNGLDFACYEENKKEPEQNKLVQKTVTCFKCWRMVHGKCARKLKEKSCLTCRTLFE